MLEELIYCFWRFECLVGSAYCLERIDSWLSTPVGFGETFSNRSCMQRKRGVSGRITRLSGFPLPSVYASLPRGLVFYQYLWVLSRCRALHVLFFSNGKPRFGTCGFRLKLLIVQALIMDKENGIFLLPIKKILDEKVENHAVQLEFLGLPTVIIPSKTLRSIALLISLSSADLIIL